MTGLEGFVCGVLVVIFIWLVSSIIKERGHEKYVKAFILRSVNFLGKTAREIKRAWKGRI
mgnify:CR=1 FL=1